MLADAKFAYLMSDQNRSSLPPYLRPINHSFYEANDKKKYHTSFQRWVLESIKPYFISDPNVRLKPICPITDQKGIKNYSCGDVDTFISRHHSHQWRPLKAYHLR